MAKSTAEMIEVMQAYERGEKIELKMYNAKNWGPSNKPLWSWSGFDYRIAKPELKKVELYAWFTGIGIVWRIEGGPDESNWKRVPSEDKIVEVEE